MTTFRGAHEAEHPVVRQRRHNPYAGHAVEAPPDRLAELRVRVRHDDDLGAGAFAGQRGQRRDDARDAATPVLAPVDRRHDDRAGAIDPCRGRRETGIEQVPQPVNDRVTGHDDVAGRHPFVEQMLPGGLGRRQVERAEPGQHRRVHLLRERPVDVPRAETGFEMDHGYAMPERDEPADQRRHVVTLDHHGGRPAFGGSASTGVDIRIPEFL